jgi:hypothetical protein
MQDPASPKVEGLENHATRIASSLLLLLANNASHLLLLSVMFHARFQSTIPIEPYMQWGAIQR